MKSTGAWTLNDKTLGVMLNTGGNVTVLSGTINTAAAGWAGVWARNGEVKSTITMEN